MTAAFAPHNFRRILLVGLAVISSALASCSSGGGSPAPKANPVEAYCRFIASPAVFASSVTVSGTAEYEFRYDGNGAVTIEPAPIRHAEVMVKNASGAIVQCTETDGHGDFTLQVPANSGTLTVQVNTRANNSHAKAYVLNNPVDNTYYSISRTIGSTSSTSGLSLIAPAHNGSTVLGGAFNILDQIVSANEFLQTKANSCASFGESCATFTVAPLVYAYWTLGFNPGNYLGDGSVGTSFYLKGTNELYILGGIDGDYWTEDADHFDNTIILHEYGHFIENNFTGSDSPGGIHYGGITIDPRLAWGEAWANFFQAAVTDNPRYRDTTGNIDCSSSNPSSCNDEWEELLDQVDSYDPYSSMKAGEGNFREFSISRVLWAGYAAVSKNFNEIWAVVAGSTNGFRSGKWYFRSVGTFHYIHENLLTGRTSWSSLISTEKQSANTKDFGSPLIAGTCTKSLDAVATTDGSFSQSDLLVDNDFYTFVQQTTGTLRVRLEYTGQSDLDLFIWKNGYQYGNTKHLLGQSKRSADGGVEEIQVNAPAGAYMINVMVNPITGGSKTASTYSLKINGTAVCPQFN